MRYIVRMINAILVILAANLPLLLSELPFQGTGIIGVMVVCGYLYINILPAIGRGAIADRRLRLCLDGCELLKIFLLSMLVSVLILILTIPILFDSNRLLWFIDLGTVFLGEAMIFWNGMIRLYLSSAQIGIKWRVIGILCGWIPLLNLVVLTKMIRLASAEVEFENYRIQSNELRAEARLCDTKYPILMVHGVFFRDFKYFNYWGRIPKDLEKNGARIYYGNHQSAASVADSGEELRARIQEVLLDSSAQKINVIAHSKGGLDTRYAISKLGMEPYIASLTTINTPHRGCEFADYLLSKIPEGMKQKIAEGYNSALRKMGDPNPDFLAAVGDLTASACKRFNAEVTDKPGVFYQSVGSKLNVESGGRFPLNFSYQLVKYFDGPNDGLVSETSFPWGSDYQFLTIAGKRGISHGDMIDLNRENIPGFDVREFYISLVHALKEKGF